MRHDSYGLVQYCNGVTEFKQVENKASNHSYGNGFSVDVATQAWERKFVCYSVHAIHDLQ